LITGKVAKNQISAMIGGNILASVTSLVDILTNLDRILTTKTPLAYAIHLKQILLLYTIFLPMQIMDGLGWFTIPTIAIAVFTLFGIENIGLEIENPFGYDANDLPLDKFCQTLHREIDILISEPIIDLNDASWDHQNFMSNLTFRRDGRGKSKLFGKVGNARDDGVTSVVVV
jgi:predicted membrane chloride channel (bestrophin family)